MVIKLDAVCMKRKSKKCRIERTPGPVSPLITFLITAKEIKNIEVSISDIISIPYFILLFYFIYVHNHGNLLPFGYGLSQCILSSFTNQLYLETGLISVIKTKRRHRTHVCT